MQEVCQSEIDIHVHVHTYHVHVHAPLYIQDIRSLDKEMRAWDVFSGLDSAVKNMVTSLRAVGELQNPAIRDRHWLQLMQATQVQCCFSYYTCAVFTLVLGVSLLFHNHEFHIHVHVCLHIHNPGHYAHLQSIHICSAA